ncbi:MULTISPECIES: TetR/AcrR family transcriptional regulator [unclassified Agarivorans]|uniref:TetR/AcrR family transcriptional regulator n=1 Tax=unclassified Agarivorans TaxID=2636026 RepID=UPI001386C1EE|nr:MULTISPECIES: TetR/AcrR family transcriptional regulator [unclassified Agarivorans]MDO6685614.1 TetR/AcrR family transcriptional regulator [Agarivorans sp. 3_MG-2023]MDO6716000.1 TetR/AcrR family transcriptional regulator [Agarivorans sp. 2_MG-2023]MDO6766163.1 TetR/AcrR family transcriptional regulator [Agarivorans sp. 1_MG-2023]
MDTAIKKRAISPEQKQLRRQQILHAAKQALTEHGYESVVLSQLANDLELSKPALYRYFANKESLFMALYLEEANHLLIDIERLSKQSLKPRVLAETIAAQPTFCYLSAILHTVLEKQENIEQAISFKRDLKAMAEQLCALFMHWSPQANQQQAITKVMFLYQSVIGCWHTSHPSATMQQVMQNDEFAILRVDFVDSLSLLLVKLLAD